MTKISQKHNGISIDTYRGLRLVLSDITFPVYEIRKYYQITNNLDEIRIFPRDQQTYYVLDDKSLEGTYAQRRLKLKVRGASLYKLKKQFSLLRQVVKNKGNTVYIDSTGLLFKYQKGSKRYWIHPHKIIMEKSKGNNCVFFVSNISHPFIAPFPSLANLEINYAHIMKTKYGPFLYDFSKHVTEPYQRAI